MSFLATVVEVFCGPLSLRVKEKKLPQTAWLQNQKTDEKKGGMRINTRKTKENRRDAQTV